jgi:hypothetical protein
MHSHFGISFLYLFYFYCIFILILYVLCLCLCCNLWFLLFVFFRSSLMWSLKTILLELFLQAHDMIMLGYKATKLNIMFNFPMYQIVWNNEQCYDFTPFQTSYVYDLLRSRELEG